LNTFLIVALEIIEKLIWISEGSLPSEVCKNSFLLLI